MANADMVLTTHENIGGNSTNFTKDVKIINSTETRSGTSNVKQTGAGCMQSVRRSFREQGFSEKATSIIMHSWRGSTKCEYQVYISRWLQFCGRQKIDSVSVSVQNVIEFLTMEFDKGLSYSSINTARSALSSMGIMLGTFTAGTHPIVGVNIFEKVVASETS